METRESNYLSDKLLRRNFSLTKKPDYFRFAQRNAVATAVVAITIPIVIAAIIESHRGKTFVFMSGCEVSFGISEPGEDTGIVAEGVIVVVA